MIQKYMHGKNTFYYTVNYTTTTRLWKGQESKAKEKADSLIDNIVQYLFPGFENVF